MKRERGFALVATLWLLVVFGAVGLEFGLRSRTRRLAVANLVETTLAEATAQTGLALARSRLSLRAAQARSLRTGDAAVLLDPWHQPQWLMVDSVRLNSGTARVALQDGGAALHLNLASEEELRRLFRALRVDFGQADRLAQVIADWRDGDDLHRPRGAEADEYRRRGLSVMPRNAPFSRLTEMHDIIGMTPELHRKVRPYLTVRGSGRVNLNAAERPVLLALAGMSEEAADVILDRRNRGMPVRSFSELALELSEGPRALLQSGMVTLQSRVVFETREVLALSEGRIDGSPVRVRLQGHFVLAGGEAVVVSWERTP